MSANIPEVPDTPPSPNSDTSDTSDTKRRAFATVSAPVWVLAAVTVALCGAFAVTRIPETGTGCVDATARARFELIKAPAPDALDDDAWAAVTLKVEDVRSECSQADFTVFEAVHFLPWSSRTSSPPPVD